MPSNIRRIRSSTRCTIPADPPVGHRAPPPAPLGPAVFLWEPPDHRQRPRPVLGFAWVCGVNRIMTVRAFVLAAVVAIPAGCTDTRPCAELLAHPPAIATMSPDQKEAMFNQAMSTPVTGFGLYMLSMGDTQFDACKAHPRMTVDDAVWASGGY